MNQEHDEICKSIALSDIMGVSLQKQQPSLPITVLSLGRDSDFCEMANNSKASIAGIMWNESCVTLVNQNRLVVARYKPELTPVAEMLFEREEKRNNEHMRIWEGEFAPVQFSKGDLLKFLKQVEMVDAPKEVIEAIRNMKVTERKELSDTISIDGDSTKMVVEETATTNIPKQFSCMIPVSDDFVGKFEFEAKVAPKKDRYGNDEANKKVIELRVINARQVLKQRMECVVARLPKEIPKYYGRMDVRVNEGKWV